MIQIAPTGPSKFLGENEIKPWQHRVTVCIPHLNTIVPLKTVIEVLLQQTEWPFIMVVDTGSPMDVCNKLEDLRAENVEIHYIRAHGYQNSSEPVTVAMDLCQSLCRTEFLFHTHSDVFLRRNDFFEDMVRIVNDNTPIVGYKMSPRDWITDDWKWMVGHTATMLHMPTIHRAGLSWSLQRMKAKFGILETMENGWPDTETGFNYLMREAGIKPIFLGEDKNFERFIDHNIDHARSYAGSKIYSQAQFNKSEEWMMEAIRDAQKRLSLTIEEIKQHPSHPNRRIRKCNVPYVSPASPLPPHPRAPLPQGL